MADVKSIERAVESLPPRSWPNFGVGSPSSMRLRGLIRSSKTPIPASWTHSPPKRLPTIVPGRLESFEAHRFEAFLAVS